MPVFDKSLITRSTGNLTASHSSSSVQTNGTPLRGMVARFIIPSSSGTTNQLLFRVWGSDDDSTYRVLASNQGGALSWTSGTLDEDDQTEVLVPFASKHKYHKTEIVISGSTGTPNFGIVKAGIVSGPAWDWERKNNFE